MNIEVSARKQTSAKADSIKILMDRLDHAYRCRWEGDPGSCDAHLGPATIELFREYHDVEHALEDIQESPLSVEVRSDWQPPGVPNGEARPLEAVEFRITLCTGGPAVQIRGDIDIEGNPLSAWLEYQDWGTPWKKYTPELLRHEEATLLEYSGHFIGVY